MGFGHSYLNWKTSNVGPVVRDRGPGVVSLPVLLEFITVLCFFSHVTDGVIFYE